MMRAPFPGSLFAVSPRYGHETQAPITATSGIRANITGTILLIFPNLYFLFVGKNERRTARLQRMLTFRSGCVHTGPR